VFKKWSERDFWHMLRLMLWTNTVPFTLVIFHDKPVPVWAKIVYGINMGLLVIDLVVVFVLSFGRDYLRAESRGKYSDFSGKKSAKDYIFGVSWRKLIKELRYAAAEYSASKELADKIRKASPEMQEEAQQLVRRGEFLQVYRRLEEEKAKTERDVAALMSRARALQCESLVDLSHPLQKTEETLNQVEKLLEQARMAGVLDDQLVLLVTRGKFQTASLEIARRVSEKKFCESIACRENRIKQVPREHHRELLELLERVRKEKFDSHGYRKALYTFDRRVQQIPRA
jgi:hypothetical protein